MTNYNKSEIITNLGAIKKWMDARYYPADTMCTITCDGEALTGYMYGNDECFDVNDFYQYFLTPDGSLYKAYYALQDSDGNDVEMDCINYDTPYAVKEEDAQYWIDYVAAE